MKAKRLIALSLMLLMGLPLSADARHRRRRHVPVDYQNRHSQDLKNRDADDQVKLALAASEGNPQQAAIRAQIIQLDAERQALNLKIISTKNQEAKLLAVIRALTRQRKMDVFRIRDLQTKLDLMSPP